MNMYALIVLAGFLSITGVFIFSAIKMQWSIAVTLAGILAAAITSAYGYVKLPEVMAKVEVANVSVK